MLIYCFEPVKLAFESALPALVGALDAGRVPLTLLGRDEMPVLEAMSFAGEGEDAAAGGAGHHSGRVTLEIRCATEDPSLLALAGELTLCRLGPRLCHLSLNCAVTGRLAAGLMYNRSFQMSVELAVAAFLGGLARSLATAASPAA